MPDVAQFCPSYLQICSEGDSPAGQPNPRVLMSQIRSFGRGTSTHASGGGLRFSYWRRIHFGADRARRERPSSPRSLRWRRTYPGHDSKTRQRRPSTATADSRIESLTCRCSLLHCLGALKKCSIKSTHARCLSKIRMLQKFNMFHLHIVTRDVELLDPRLASFHPVIWERSAPRRAGTARASASARLASHGPASVRRTYGDICHEEASDPNGCGTFDVRDGGLRMLQHGQPRRPARPTARVRLVQSLSQ